MFLLVEAVTGRALAACLALILYNVGIPLGSISLVSASGLAYVGTWIYAPDVWLAMCVMPALWMAWRGKLGWAILFAAMAAGFKETGFVTFPLVMVFYAWPRRRWDKRFWVLIAVGALMAAIRMIGVGPGWILGSNRAIWWRMFRFAAGEPLNILVSLQAQTAILGIAVAVAIIGGRSRWLRYGSIPLGIGIASLVAWYAGVDDGVRIQYEVALCSVLDWHIMGNTVVRVATWVLAAYAGVRGPDRSLIALFLVGYYVLGLPSTIAPQTGMRSLYTALMMCSAIQALCIWAMVTAVVRHGKGEGSTAAPLVGPVA